MSLLFQEQFNQPINLSGSFTGSFSGSITTASFASTASYWSGSVLNTTSASFASTASYLNGSYVSSSIYDLFTSSYYTDSASFNYRIDNIVVDTGSYNIPPVVVNVATTAILPRSPLYNNGPSNDGINSYLSASISGTLGSIDGVSLTTGDNILVKNQTNQIQNGVYNVISTGSLSTFYILSRSLSSDETSELDSQIVIPSFGTTNRGGIFAQTTNNPIIGTDNIVYSLQTNTLISQTSAGTQAIYQIPWYIASTRQLSKGSPNLKYINVTSGNTVTTSSLILTGSLTISGSEIITGSLQITNGITGSLLGTASFTSTASFASTASYLNGGVTSASFASTASYWSGSVLNTTSASFASTAVTASYAILSAGSSGAVFSTLLASTSTNSIDNGNFTQIWNWNSISSGSGLRLSSNSTSALSNTQTLLEITQSGANSSSSQTTYGLRINNTKTGTTATNVGLYVDATGGAVNYAIQSNGTIALINGATSKIQFANSNSIFEFFGVLNMNTNSFLINTNSGAGAMLGVYSGGLLNFATGWVNSYSQPFMTLGGYREGTIQWRANLQYPVIFQNINGDLSLSQNNGLTYGSVFTPTERIRFKVNGNVGFGLTNPTARLHLTGSNVSASTAPLKFAAGTTMSIAESGSFEYNGVNLFFTRTDANRETVFVGTQGATAPSNTITPVSWSQVVIDNTIYKIPLYQ